MLTTAGDVIQRSIDFVGGQQGGDLLVNKCRRAVQDAVRDFPTMYRWNWYQTLGRVNLHKSQQTGTVAYNSSTRVLTLTGATWPSWALRAMVRNGQQAARVQSVTDPTHLVLDASYTFPADIPAGSPYRIFLDCYPLPANFAAAMNPLREAWWGGLQYVPPQSWLWGIRGYDITGVPVKFTIQALSVNGVVPPGGTSGFAMFVSPYPNEDRTLDFMYYRLMRPVLFDIGINNGTLTTSGDGLTCTFTIQAVVPAMIGSVIRITNGKLAPELKGTVIHEATIVAVPNSSSVTLSLPCSLVSTAGLGFTISDPIDVDAASMSSAFQWMALKTLAMETMSKMYGTVAKGFEDAYLNARNADARYAGPDRMGPNRRGHSPFWHGPAPTETG